MLLLTHRPITNGRGYRVISVSRNFEKRYDGLEWLVRVECKCDMCTHPFESGPGMDEYDVDDLGMAFPFVPGGARHPANIPAPMLLSRRK